MGFEVSVFPSRGMKLTRATAGSVPNTLLARRVSGGTGGGTGLVRSTLWLGPCAHAEGYDETLEPLAPAFLASEFLLQKGLEPCRFAR